MSQSSKNQRKKTHIANLYQRTEDLAKAVLELQAVVGGLMQQVEKLEKKKKKKKDSLIISPEEL